MPSIFKYIDSLNKSELLILAEKENLDLSNLTVPDMKGKLVSHYTKNPDQLANIPGFTEFRPGSPIPSTSQETMDLPGAFLSLASAIRSSTDTRQNRNHMYLALKEIKTRKISFSGALNEDVEMFIKQFDKVVEFYQLTDFERLKVLFEILQGQAGVLFQANEDSITDIDEAEDLLKTVFRKQISDKQLRINMLLRSMADLEKIDVYISVMQNMNAKLKKPLTEEELYELIRDGVHPSYADSLEIHKPTNLESLTTCCRAFELKRDRKKQYSQPPPHLMIDEEFGNLTVSSHKKFVKPQVSCFQQEEEITEEVTACMATKPKPKPTSRHVATQTQSESEKKPSPHCWNCDFPGHQFMQCKAPRKIFCYSCGKKDTYANQCECNPTKPLNTKGN